MAPSRLPVARRDATLTHSAATLQVVAVEVQQVCEEVATGTSSTQAILASQDAHLTNIETTLASHDKILAEIDQSKNVESNAYALDSARIQISLGLR
jgi:hypothetical protein